MIEIGSNLKETIESLTLALAFLGFWYMMFTN
jgi:hypothetical protein